MKGLARGSMVMKVDTCTQPVFTSSEPTMETPQQLVKSVQSL